MERDPIIPNQIKANQTEGQLILEQDPGSTASRRSASGRLRPADVGPGAEPRDFGRVQSYEPQGFDFGPYHMVPVIVGCLRTFHHFGNSHSGQLTCAYTIHSRVVCNSQPAEGTCPSLRVHVGT